MAAREQLLIVHVEKQEVGKYPRTNAPRYEFMVCEVELYGTKFGSNVVPEKKGPHSLEEITEHYIEQGWSFFQEVVENGQTVRRIFKKAIKGETNPV